MGWDTYADTAHAYFDIVLSISSSLCLSSGGRLLSLMLHARLVSTGGSLNWIDTSCFCSDSGMSTSIDIHTMHMYVQYLNALGLSLA